MGLERTPCEFEIIPRPVEPGIRVYCKRCQVRVGSWKLPVGAELVLRTMKQHIEDART